MYEPGYLLERRLTPQRLEFYGNAGPLGAARDLLKRTDAGWRFAVKLCIYDSEMIPNSIIYPI